MPKGKCARSVLLKKWDEGDATLTTDGKVVICQVCNKNIKMATWASSLDVLADLDRLSEFSLGATTTRNSEVLSLQSYGRGNARTDKHSVEEPSFVNKDEDILFPVLPRFSPGSGRGERILALTRHRQAQSLQRQLRMAMGPGYSNELIEDFIRGESASDQSSEVGQFDDHDSLSEETTEESAALEKEESTSSLTSHSPKEPVFTAKEDQELETSMKEKQFIDLTQINNKIPNELPKQKKKSGRSRNALLNNLPNYNVSRIETACESENETDSSKLDVTNTCDEMKPVLPLRKHNTDEPSIAREMHNGFSLRKIPVRLRRDNNSFKFREEDFPPL